MIGRFVSRVRFEVSDLTFLLSSMDNVTLATCRHSCFTNSECHAVMFPHSGLDTDPRNGDPPSCAALQNMCSTDPWVRQRCRSTCGACVACKASQHPTASPTAAVPVGECHLLSSPASVPGAAAQAGSIPLKPSAEWDVHQATRAWAPITWTHGVGPVVAGPPVMLELVKLLDSVVRENQIIYFAVNGHFLSLLDNMVCSLRRLNLHNFLVVALDRRAEKHCRSHGYTVWPYPFNSEKAHHGGAAGGSYIESDGLVDDDKLTNYLLLTIHKVYFANWCLELRPEYDLLFLDSDIVLMQDPLEYILRTYSRDVHMLFQGPCPTAFQMLERVDHTGKTAVNTGVMYLRGHPATRAFLNRVQTHHNQKHIDGLVLVDQAVFEELLPSASIEWQILDTAVFPVACMSSGPLNNWHLGVLWPHSLDISPVLVHMNLSPASKKISKLKQLGLWLLDDDDDDQSASLHCMEDWQPPAQPAIRSGGGVRGHFEEALGVAMRRPQSTVPGSLAHHMIESDGSCMPNFADYMLKANLRAYEEAGLVATP